MSKVWSCRSRRHIRHGVAGTSGPARRFRASHGCIFRDARERTPVTTSSCGGRQSQMKPRRSERRGAMVSHPCARTALVRSIETVHILPVMTCYFLAVLKDRWRLVGHRTQLGHVLFTGRMVVLARTPGLLGQIQPGWWNPRDNGFLGQRESHGQVDVLLVFEGPIPPLAGTLAAVLALEIVSPITGRHRLDRQHRRPLFGR